MKVTIVSKAPPGGRCTLYLGYARTIADCFGAEVEIVHPAPEAEVQPPALLVDGRLIAPADGIILSPEDVHDAVTEVGIGFPDLLDRLETAETDFMKGCEP